MLINCCSRVGGRKGEKQQEALDDSSGRRGKGREREREGERREREGRENY